ncbi:Indole-3-acetic acid-induced protein ARG7 [Senna tora]|uniref:Indole-3-acetic acid-induced protein ARG7 n=1 Tax=Senna tora TaxID=362788 RepID=A0A834T4X1_9FABA|nr:Indole-3-acetic acid-induced protein ARG7 [Senna tora]
MCLLGSSLTDPPNVPMLCNRWIVAGLISKVVACTVGLEMLDCNSSAEGPLDWLVASLSVSTFCGVFPSVMIKPKLLLSSSEKTLKQWVSKPGDGDDVPRPVFTNVHSKMSFWDILRKTIFFVVVVVALFLPETRASSQDLLQNY